MSTITWIYGCRLKEWKNVNIKILLGFEPVCWMIRKDRLRLYGQMEHNEGTDWIRRCTVMAVGVRQMRCPRKKWWVGFKEDRKAFGVSQEVTDVQNTGT